MVNLVRPEDEAVKRSPRLLSTVSPAKDVWPEIEAIAMVPPLVVFGRKSTVPRRLVVLSPSLPLNVEIPVPERGEKVRLPVVLPPSVSVAFLSDWIVPSPENARPRPLPPESVVAEREATGVADPLTLRTANL